MCDARSMVQQQRSLALAALVSVVAVVLAALSVPAPAHAAEPVALTLTAPAQYADSDTTLRVSLKSGTVPAVGAEVEIERAAGSSWVPVGTVTTDADGSATLPVPVARTTAANRVRARFAGTPEHDPAVTSYQLPLRAHATRIVIGGPTKVVDEKSITLRILRRTTDGRPVPGRVFLQRYHSRAWHTVKTLEANSSGYVDLTIAPRADTWFRAVGRELSWAVTAASPSHRVDNVPQGAPVSMGRGPSPRIMLPAQARAVTGGAAPVISTISDAIWRSMVGRSWHAGCPVGRSGLRILRINYWDYSGYRRRGEIVAAAGVIKQMAAALTDMYHAKLPIRAMYRVDRFGWSSRLGGADDYRSMAAGNTSAFNCRSVVGRPGVRSPHAYGRALDVNTWENPYRSSHGWVPNTWWPRHSHGRIAWRNRSHQVVRIMASHGLRWTYGTGDSQHFDAVPRGGRPIVIPGCENVVCH